ncbi:putative carboxylesterase 2 [Zea mays]|uniref:Putative carboxylesterase 2 n=1 Tax=Zea mays TaxID=4577 RepID=A0A1D6I5Z7_MAIZE|nr:putative carboxylesterase 2 [Zea mays]
MEPDVDEVVFDAPGYFRIYKNGRVDRFNEPVLVAAGVDDSSGVSSKDVVLDADTGLSVRLFLPNRHGPCGEKLPVLVYFHGGGFIIGSAKSAMYHNYLTALASAAGVLAVSVDYRLAPEHQLPAAYDDCWAALRWAASARDGWIAEHGDAGRVFVAGDSAGGNIVHNVLMKASSADKGAPRIEGAVLLHAFFGGSTAIDVEPERAGGFIRCFARMADRASSLAAVARIGGRLPPWPFPVRDAGPDAGIGRGNRRGVPCGVGR